MPKIDLTPAETKALSGLLLRELLVCTLSQQSILLGLADKLKEPANEAPPQPCPDCDGVGNRPYIHNSSTDGEQYYSKAPCPTCGGSGKVLYEHPHDWHHFPISYEPCPDCTPAQRKEEQ